MNYREIITDDIVYGLESSIKRAKYPKSTDTIKVNNELTDGIKNLAQSKQGEGHDQWLTGVIVQFDLTLTIKAWTEAERYHFFDFISSQSTMHRITKFDLDKAYVKYVDGRIVKIMKEKVENYNHLANKVKEWKELGDAANVEIGQELLSQKYLEILYSNPCGFRLTAGMTTNYRQLKTIYHQRKSHRLPEWRAFCEWIRTLPMSELITGDDAR